MAKFGGSLLDVKGTRFSTILRRIKESKAKNDFGPIVVFSAPMGCTDELIRIGESYAQSAQVSVNSVFRVYDDIAKLHIMDEYLEQAQAELANYKRRLDSSSQ